MGQMGGLQPGHSSQEKAPGSGPSSSHGRNAPLRVRHAVWGRRRWRLAAGPLALLGAIGVVEALSWTPFRVPNAPAVILLAVVFSAFVSGLWPGLLSAAAGWAYFAYFFSVHGQSGQLFAYTADDYRRVVVWAAATPAMALMVGVLKRRGAEREELLRSVLDNMGEGVAVADSSGRFVLFNPKAEQIVGMGPVEAPPSEWPERYGVYLPDGKAPFPPDAQPLVQALRGTATDDVEMLVRNPHVPRGVHLSVTGRPLLRGGTVRGGVVVFRDVTELKRAQEEARRSSEEKAASLSRLAAQAAHEINNPLTALMGYLERVKTRTARDPDLAAAVERMERSTARVRDLARGLTDLARAGQMELGEVELGRVLEEVRKALEADFEKHSVRVEWEVSPDLSAIRGNAEHLHQVFFNLFLNARQAMGTGGTLRVQAAPANGEVRVSVGDTGPGVPPDIREHIFEPFFTTKPKEEGTGLGLAICQSAVSAHGGRIELESEPGRGATFTVTLPVRPRGERGP